MSSPANLGNITAMMTDAYLFREEQRPYNQVVSKTPLSEPFQHVIGEQD